MDYGGAPPGDDCTCTAGQDWKIDDGSDCTLSSECNLGSYSFWLNDGTLTIGIGGQLTANACYILDKSLSTLQGGLQCGTWNTGN